ncbi:MAG TPA: HDIG domain-containing protein [bacterium]|nr:HDIG domain-containing protein [bacterium]HPR88793.1 HDIG domain-containing protein [bacterium]
MEKKVLSLFPEFGLIEDPLLRANTLACWLEAMRRGGWEAEDLDRIPFTLLIPDCRVSYRTHVQAVAQTAIAAARVLAAHYVPYYTLSMDLIVSGSLLHDIGKLLEYRCVEGKFTKSSNGKLLRHPFSGANLAARYDLPDEIVHIIAVHAKEGDGGYRTPEAVIIHHADFMNFEPLKP